MWDMIVFFIVYFSSLFSICALFYYLTPYQNKSLNKKFKEIKEPPITKENIEKILKLFKERTSQPSMILAKVGEKKYWLFLMILSLTQVFLLFTITTHFIFFSLILLYALILDMIIVQRSEFLKEAEGVFVTIFLLYIMSFLLLFGLAYIFALVYTAPNTNVWMGIMIKDWYLTIAGIAFSFSVSLWFVTTLYSVLKQEHKVTKTLLNKIRISIQNDETDDLEKYYENNEELLKETYSSYEDSKITGKYVRMLTYMQFLFLIFGIIFVLFDLSYYHLVNKEVPEQVFYFDQTVLAWFFLCVIIVGVTIISFVKHIMIKLPELEDEET